MEEFCEEVEVDSYPSFRVYKAGKILGDYCGSKAEKVCFLCCMANGIHECNCLTLCRVCALLT